MKAKSGEDELNEALSGIKKLGGECVETLTFDLVDEDQINQRGIVVIEKKAKTPTNYPRKFGQIKNKPL